MPYRSRLNLDSVCAEQQLRLNTLNCYGSVCVGSSGFEIDPCRHRTSSNRYGGSCCGGRSALDSLALTPYWSGYNGRYGCGAGYGCGGSCSPHSFMGGNRHCCGGGGGIGFPFHPHTMAGIGDGPTRIVENVVQLLSDDPCFEPEHWTHGQALGFYGLYRNDVNVLQKLNIVEDRCTHAIGRIQLERAADPSVDERPFQLSRSKLLSVLQHIVRQVGAIRSHIEMNGATSQLSVWNDHM